ncbi:iron ABC transporter substrate-binding protein [Naasia sp. SYSU D00948]|uniref:iron ABC transporter substrate-binding protein n=1 Tax=Naasia sp. SYSU D00948 TaxID=2817379 RepID=UPI001B3130E2|nr:iron ABC transporter substrate-binding protein [Naasia sp. SYSU D00948]
MPSLRLPAGAAALATVLLVSACAPASGGGDDDTLSLYSGRDEELVQPLIDRFEEESGIQVEVRYGNTAEMAALLLEEGENTPADVFLSQDAGALGALSDAGLFEVLPSELSGTVPAGFTSTDGTWIGITGRARVIAYDAQTLAEDQVPDSVDAFTSPDWAGRFGIAPGNASFQAFVTAYRVLRGEEAADAWVAGIAANEPQIFDNNRAILSAVNDGALDAGLLNHYYWFGMAEEVGADGMRAQLKFPAVGDPGSIVNVTGAGMLAGGSGDDDALTLLEFLVSEEAQEYFVDEVHEYPLVEGVAAPEGLPELQSLVNPDLDLADLATLSETQELLAKHGLL